MIISKSRVRDLIHLLEQTLGDEPSTALRADVRSMRVTECDLRDMVDVLKHVAE